MTHQPKVALIKETNNKGWKTELDLLKHKQKAFNKFPTAHEPAFTETTTTCLFGWNFFTTGSNALANNDPVLFEVSWAAVTSAVDGDLVYLLRQWNRYPYNPICYAEGTFPCQNHLQAKFLQIFCQKNTTYSCSNLLLRARDVNAQGCRWST